VKLAVTDRPFKADQYLSAADLATLSDWLEASGNKDAVIGGTYTVADLIKDLDSIMDGVWSDSIDAMGEDA
jgi:hypothetical protein